jgi:ubiquinone/menaquinone biosynthesis C-methylase UbiE
MASHPHSSSHFTHVQPHTNHDNPAADSESNAHANRRHFDQQAGTYDSPHHIDHWQKQSHFLLEMYPFDKDSTTVMDFACGTGVFLPCRGGPEKIKWSIGLVSRELAPHVKSIVGVDISQGMVDQYNKYVDNQGILPQKMNAVCTELKGQEGELNGRKFDLIVVR